MTAHLFIPGYMCAPSEYCLSSLSWGCVCFMLSVKMAKSSV